MKIGWKLPKPHTVAKVVVLAYCMFGVIAILGKTGSYWQAFNAGVIFFSIFSLARMTVKEQP